MNLNDKIYIAGHSGLVGSAILNKLKLQGFNNILTRSHQELDLTNQIAVNKFFEDENPKFVILAAAKVGGIHANQTYPAEFIYENIMIEANVIHSAYLNKVKRLLFLGSTCIYPKSVVQPMSEEALLSGILESTNEPYAIAKIAGIKLCESYNIQYKTDFRSVMPTNLYGANDNFHLQNSHVIPALIRKMHLAKCLKSNNWDLINKDLKTNPIDGMDEKLSKKEIIELLSNCGVCSNKVDVWGSGNVRREFLEVNDMADASLFLMGLDKNIYQENIDPMLSHINIGTGEDVTIKKVSELIRKIVGFDGELFFDKLKPEGPAQKFVDISRLKSYGWSASTKLDTGLTNTYDWYLSMQIK
jgi:GDP-L-fucose synthase